MMCAPARVISGVILALVLSPALGRAQDRPAPDQTVVRAERWRLDEGATLRVFTRGVGLVEGRLERVADQELVVRQQGTATAIRLVWIDSLWVRTSAGKRGALLGGVGGAIGGALIGALGCTGACDARGAAVALGALIGTGAGAVGGWTIGSRYQIWDRRHP